MDLELQYEDQIYAIFDTISETKPSFNELKAYNNFIKTTSDQVRALEEVDNRLQISYHIRKELQEMIQIYGIQSKVILNVLLRKYMNHEINLEDIRHYLFYKKINKLFNFQFNNCAFYIL